MTEIRAESYPPLLEGFVQTPPVEWPRLLEGLKTATDRMNAGIGNRSRACLKRVIERDLRFRAPAEVR